MIYISYFILLKWIFPQCHPPHINATKNLQVRTISLSIAKEQLSEIYFFLSFLNTPVTHNTQQGIFFIHLQHFEIVKCINRQELHKHNETKMDSKIKDPSKHVPYHYQILNERRWRYNNPRILYLKYTALFLYPCIVFLHHICKKKLFPFILLEQKKKIIKQSNKDQFLVDLQNRKSRHKIYQKFSSRRRYKH